MKELDIYLRAKHDVSNQLQLLSIYSELEDYEKLNSIIERWSSKLQREQRFIQLPWNLFVENVIRHKLTTDFHFDYEVDVSGYGEEDEWITEEFNRWIKEVQGTDVLIEVKEEEDYHFKFSIDGRDTVYHIKKKRGV